ncbi:hypothetical protein CR513_30454, partial [Mucuna pruriens]
PSSTGKKQKLKQSATKQQLFVGQEIYDESALELPDSNGSKKGQDVTDSSGMMVAPVPLGEPVVKNQSLENAAAHTPEMKKTSDPDDVQEKNHVNMLKHASKKNHINCCLSKTKESTVARRFSRRLSGAEPDQLTNVANEQALQVPKRNLRKSRSVLDTDLTNKSFQQLNGVLEVERSHKMQREVLLNSNKFSNKKEQQILCRASKRLAGFEPELMSSSISNERTPKYKSEKSKGLGSATEINATLQQSDDRPAMGLADHASINGESSNKGKKVPETTPMTSNQLKKFDAEEMNNDEKSEPEQSFAFHYSWSDPCLEFAIQTLTGALPVEDSVGNGPARISETDMSSKNKLVKNVTGRSSYKNSRVNSKKSKNKKELPMPRRLSKRLAGHEPEVLPTEKAIEYATRKWCNDKPAAAAILTNGVSGHLHASEESKIIVQASDRLKTLCGESSSKSEKSYDAQTDPNEQLQRLEAENVDDDKSDPQLPSPFGDSWSDPCLEFAIKTLTGALPVDASAAPAILPVMTVDVNDSPSKELLESMEQKSINEEARDKPEQFQTKKELTTVCQQPSKQVLNQPELKTYSTSCGNYPKFAARESYKDEDNVTRNFNERESQRVKVGNAIEIDINKTILEEPSEENQVLEGESVAEKPQPETINRDNSERASCVSFMDSWSDPCLEFAFKTLTGAIPVEENIAIQGFFQEPANRHDQRGGGSMVPKFGFSSISHSGFSLHNDIGEKSKQGQQSSTSSSFLPQEKQNLHGFSGVAPQEQYFQYSKNFQR